jgi:hypothetical protein
MLSVARRERGDGEERERRFIREGRRGWRIHIMERDVRAKDPCDLLTSIHEATRGHTAPPISS